MSELKRDFGQDQEYNENQADTTSPAPDKKEMRVRIAILFLGIFFIALLAFFSR